MSIHNAIVACAPQQANLVHQLDSLRNTPSLLQEHQRKQENIKRAITESTNKIKKLEEITIEKRAGHEHLRDSLSRKVTAQLSGKKKEFQEKKADAERQYVVALETEMQERRNLETYQNDLKVTQSKVHETRLKAEQFHIIEADLHNLYDSVFLKYKHDYHEDSTLRSEVASALSSLQKPDAQITAKKARLDFLRQAKEMVHKCYRGIERAERATSFHDMLHGGSVAIEEEQSALVQAQAHMDSAQALAEKSGTPIQAPNLSQSFGAPEVTNLAGGGVIAQPSRKFVRQ
ncbi:hypothetical protein DL96DRAFT_246946 [Flagelloscypha sp. PMI_526]|nr:hypothetical protein DL96DRAFT_246946 [Flagelloscypha sp. PMI_526]